MRFLRRWWPLLAFLAVVAVIVAGTLIPLSHDPGPNVDRPLRFEPTVMTDSVRHQP